ncbi:MAG: glycosyltransferase family 2 protein [Alphaproteobacteria bacterium]|nr:MAG: glycosyltransferase family 2 protein [Alphaproteobacteria bacterium]
MTDSDHFRVAILIVSFRNPQDVQACLTALSRSTAEPRFDIFVCENGGSESFHELCDTLMGPQGPCITVSDDLPVSRVSASARLMEVKCLALKDHPSRVWIGCAAQNLGYAGGVNVWIDRLLTISGWEGIWILNPDAEPEPGALRALVERAVAGNKGMVGSTIVPSANRSYVHCRAGHRWRKLRTNLALIGLGEPVNRPIDLQAIEAALDCIAGGSMYVTRACLEKTGPMDERFFLFYEDADWSIRAKKHGLGYARDSIVAHRGGTTIGSARLRAERSRLSVYLESRNHLHFVRMHWHRYLPVAIFLGCVYATIYLFALAPKNFKTAMDGLWAGIKGETGPPTFYD